LLTENLLLPTFGSIIFLLFINIIRSSHFSIERSFLWLFVGIIILTITIFPNFIDKLSYFIGIYYPPSVLFLCSILFLLYIIFRQEQLMTNMDAQIKTLAQSNALLENKVKIINDSIHKHNQSK
tara:strand:- start:2597 stop:2968 length:372 start_codon:yes stop_codon:yes gene_type:complete